MSNLCPLCNSPNYCGLVESPETPNNCWCMQTNIPQSVLTKIPTNQINLACICKACALQLNSHNTAES